MDLVSKMSARQKIALLRNGYCNAENIKNAIRSLDACDPKCGIDENYRSLLDIRMKLENHLYELNNTLTLIQKHIE